MSKPVLVSPVRDPSLRNPPYIKGSVIRDVRDWAQKTGAAFFEQALVDMTDGEKEMMRGQILSSSWYPLSVWMKFLDAYYEASRVKTGETLAAFDRRNLRQAGSQTLKRIYSMMLGFMSPTRVAAMAPNMYSSIMSEGVYDLASNERGKAVLRCRDVSALVMSNIRRFYPLGAEMLLEMNGARDIRIESVERTVGGRYEIEVTLTYTV